MKYSYLKLAAIFCSAALALSSCAESGEGDKTTDAADAKITLSTESLEASAEGATIDVTTAGAWSVTSNRSWCTVSAESGSGNGSVKVSFDTNTESRKRSAELMFANTVDTCRVAISQAEGVYAEGMHYKIPVVFQIFYTRESNTDHYLTQEQIYELFDHAKAMYDNCGTDLGFELVLAEEDEQGNTLAEPGISRNKVNLAIVSYRDFMYDAYNDYVQYMWDPSKYINISLYEFSGMVNPVGISQSAYLMSDHVIDGTVALNTYAAPKELLFPMCVSLNNKYVGSDGSIESEFNDLKSTLGHELGHMFGLKHVFFENGSSIAGGDDTDFCGDTPTYNRLAYNEAFSEITGDYFNEITTVAPSEEAIAPFFNRTASGVKEPYEFESTNIMDYALGRFTTFSAEQAARMRHLIKYSPYLPGCKAVDFSTYTKTRAASDIPVHLHICK